MTTATPKVGVYILAKNEAANIGRSLNALATSGWPVRVLDSGSTDGTQSRAAKYSNVTVIPYHYIDHCTAYNEITTTLGRDFDIVLILDADMMVSRQLQQEILQHLNERLRTWAALRAPIEMWVDGLPLRHGSLCPPKAFAFKTGAPLFVSTGHAERLAEHVRVNEVLEHLVHDDRKDYSSFLRSQMRYSENLFSRYQKNAVSPRDRLRLRTPLLILIVPFVSYLLKGGILAGRTGILYALDRLIAEAIMYRHSVANKLKDKTNTE